MIHSIKSAAVFGAILFLIFVSSLERSQAQMPLPVYTAPSPIVTVKRPLIHRCTYDPAVRQQVNYPAYYAPQVPVIPMAQGPVPTMSAYYVPTVPVAQTYYAAVVPVRRARRYAIPVAPAVVHPVYWLPY